MNPWLCNLLFNNSGGSSLPATGQTFYAPLKTSLVPEVGTGGPSWSRATAAWRFNDMGVLRQIPSGCAEFGGARLVVNLAPRSEVINAGWTLSGVTASDANTLLESAGGTTHQCSTSIIILGTYLLEVWLKRGTGSTRHVRLEVSSSDLARVNFNLDTGEIASIAQSGSLSLISYGADASVDAGGYRRFYIRVNAIASASNTFYPARLTESLNGPVSYSGDGTSSVLVSKVKISDVTGRDASYIPEYVSVGVLFAPYHGAGVDGCKYFATDWQGAPIPVASLTRLRKESSATNALMWSRDFAGATSSELSGSATTKAWVPSVTGSTLVTNGTFDTDLTGWTNTGSTSASVVNGAMRLDSTSGSGGRYQAISVTVGKTYLITADFTFVSGSGTASILIYTDNSFGTVLKSNLLSSSGSANIIFKAAYSSQQRLYISSASGRVVDIDNVVIKEVTCVPERTATGLGGIANTATTLTATATDAIILQPTSGIASAARCASAYVKRVTGTGTISFTQDGGSTWTDITSQLNSATYSRVQITATLANPSVGFKISTPGDAIAVDCVQNEAGAVATSPIVTTTTTVSRNADVLTYQTAGNIDATVGSCYVMYSAYEEVSTFRRAIIGLSTTADASNALLYNSSSVATTSLYSGDGTTSISKSGLLSAANTPRKRAISWGGSTRLMTGDGIGSTSGEFSGTLPSTAIGICGYTTGTLSISGRIGDVAIYNYKMTDAELQAITT